MEQKKCEGDGRWTCTQSVWPSMHHNATRATHCIFFLRLQEKVLEDRGSQEGGKMDRGLETKEAWI